MKNKKIVLYAIGRTDKHNSWYPDEAYASFNEAVRDFLGILHEQSNYNYSLNKDNIYTLYENVYKNEDDEEPVINIIVQCSIREYKEDPNIIQSILLEK